MFKNFLAVSTKAKHKHISWSSSFTPRYTHYRNAHTGIFTAPNWKLPKRPSTVEWINKSCYIHDRCNENEKTTSTRHSMHVFHNIVLSDTKEDTLHEIHSHEALKQAKLTRALKSQDSSSLQGFRWKGAWGSFLGCLNVLVFDLGADYMDVFHLWRSIKLDVYDRCVKLTQSMRRIKSHGVLFYHVSVYFRLYLERQMLQTNHYTLTKFYTSHLKKDLKMCLVIGII